jgi:hypothetical protein
LPRIKPVAAVNLGGPYADPRSLADYILAARRDAMALTVTKFVRTRTVTRRKTVTAKKRQVQARGLENIEDSVTDGRKTSAPVRSDAPQALYARNLCPRCPVGAAIGKTNNGGNSVTFCCKARRTITIRKTRTKSVTRTVTSVPVGLAPSKVGYIAD